MSKFAPCEACGLYPCVCEPGAPYADPEDEYTCILCGDTVQGADCISTNPAICIACDLGEELDDE